MTYFQDYLIMLAPIQGVTNFPVYSIVHGKNFYRLIVASLSSLLTAAAQVKYCMERDGLSMVTIQPTYQITKVNFMHTLKQCSAITECLHGYTDLQFSVRYLTPTRFISYQCCSFRKKTFINTSRLGGYSQPRLFQVHTVVV